MGQQKLKRKRLFYDIETSPNVGLFWRAGYKLNIGYDNIIQERRVICVSYKFEGEETHTLTWDRKKSDYTLLKKFVKVMESADELIAHNGDKFDLKWIKGRCLFHRIPIPARFITTDTLKLFRRHFSLNSNRLDYIGQYLGLHGKLEHSGFDMWKQITMDNDPEAMALMVKYCERDVELLEQVFNVLRPYVEQTLHYGVMYDQEKFTCPECGAHKVRAFNKRVTQMGTIRRQMVCRKCDTRYTISNKAYMDLLVWRRDNGIGPNGHKIKK